VEARNPSRVWVSSYEAAGPSITQTKKPNVCLLDLSLVDGTHKAKAIERESDDSQSTVIAAISMTKNIANTTTRGKLQESLPLYTERCVALLQRALDEAVATDPESSSAALASSSYKNTRHNTAIPARYASSSEDGSSSEEDEQAPEGSSTSDSEDSSGKPETATLVTAESSTTTATEGAAPAVASRPDRAGKNNKTAAPKDAVVRKHVDSIPCVQLNLPPDDAGNEDGSDNRQQVLELPSCLLSKHDESGAAAQCRSLLQLARALTSTEPPSKPVVVLFLRSGRFAGAVFSRDRVLHHTTSTRYTVRKGQGKAQSAQDGQRRPQSMGAQLRRQGERQLDEDVAAALGEWRETICEAALIFVSVPKTMKKSLFENGGEHCLQRDDPRIRRVPLDLGRPSFENVCLIHAVLTTVSLRERIAIDDRDNDTNEVLVETKKKEESAKAAVVEKKPPVIEAIPLSALHIAAQNGDVEAIRLMLESDNDDDKDDQDDIAGGSSSSFTLTMKHQVRAVAGETLMTPLHYAAESSSSSSAPATGTTIAAVDPETAAECVRLLLEQGHADPCTVDARGRVPYFLATQDVVRDAFRMARATLGEDYCDWDAGAKVGPPLTPDDLEQRKEKEAEKKRKKRARQKEKKAKEKAEQREADERRKEAEERIKQEEEAKRVRAGLQPKVGGGGVCDFCQTVCKGRKRTQMFKRLDYSYCSTDCVQKHKRELMAAAATARFGGN